MIRYRFETSPGEEVVFEIDPEGGAPAAAEGAVPDWALLDRHRCDPCTLDPAERRACPAALAILPAVEAFSKNLSFEDMTVGVEIEGIGLRATLPAQRAVRSLLGLQLALSDCPVMRRLRPMARFHVPFGAKEHTAFRFLATHLIAQHLRREEGKPADFSLDGLHALFSDVHRVNARLADRIRAASEQDAAVNSLVLLDNFAHVAEINIEQSTRLLRPLFEVYLQDQGGPDDS